MYISSSIVTDIFDKERNDKQIERFLEYRKKSET